MGSWRARCLATGTPGSEVRAGETDRPKGQHRAPARPYFHALCEADRLEVLLVNARHVKNVPGRKTDVKDAEWLAQLCEVGLLRGSFIPPAEIAAIREVCRYRKKLTQARTSELQRLCRFDAHHALLARMHLEHIDHLAGMIGRLDTQIEQMVAPFCEQVRALCTIPGIGERTAQVLIGEIGVDMSRFPSADHLASWAGLCPGNNESAGKHRSGKTRKGNREVREALVEAAWAAGRTGTYLGARFRRLHRRFGKQGGSKAAVAIAHNLLVIVWFVLHDHAGYRDLGADYFTRRDNPDATKRRLIRELQALGYAVDLTPAA